MCVQVCTSSVTEMCVQVCTSSVTEMCVLMLLNCASNYLYSISAVIRQRRM